MSSSSLFPRRSPSSPPDTDLANSAIVRLRAEESAAESSTTKAVLLHEIAVLEDALGDESAAARDHLSAVNADPEFREPLERLIAIVGRRQSHKNMGKLLDRLVRVADGVEERSRALLEQAAFIADVESDPAAALPLLLRAADESPQEAAAWLAIEVTSAALGNDVLRRRALEARTELAHDALWKTLLLLDLAGLSVEAGDAREAIAAVELAVDAGGPAAFDALQGLQDVGHRLERPEFVARGLVGQAQLIIDALGGSEAPTSAGVPKYLRTAAHAADRWRRAADVLRTQGDFPGAIALLEQALKQLPGEPGLIHARLALAEVSGDTATAAELARRQLESTPSGPLASAHWLRVAEVAAEQGNAADALAAVTQAVRASPDSLPARGLELDMLSAGADPQALALAIERTAEQMAIDEGKARWLVLAAEEWARGAGDIARAKASLAKVAMLGGSAALPARVGRFLSILCGLGDWREETTRRLATTVASDSEKRDLWFELAHQRILSRDPEEAARLLGSLATAPGGLRLGRTLAAYALSLIEPAEGPDADQRDPHMAREVALQALADLDLPESTRRALHLGIVSSAMDRGRETRALQILDRLLGEDPSSKPVAAALAALRRAAGDPLGAAEALSACAAATTDPEVQAALALEAGQLWWQADRRTDAIRAFTLASRAAAPSATALLGWALRTADPDSVRGRRQALEAAEIASDGPWLGLERFALEIGAGGDRAAAALAIDAANVNASGDLSIAALLARGLWAPSEADVATQLGALETLALQAHSTSALAAMATYQAKLRGETESYVPEARALAERWAACDPSTEAALEWLASAVRANDTEAEMLARAALIERVDPEARPALQADLALLKSIHKMPSSPLLGAKDPASTLVNLELALPGSPPAARAAALDGLGDLLGSDDAGLRASLVGYNLLALGNNEGAIRAFCEATALFPGDPAPWEGLRDAARHTGNIRLLAEATASLAKTLRDPAKAAELWEEAGLLFFDELQDAVQGEHALTSAVKADVRRSVAFDRVFRLVRARQDHASLLALIAPRVDVSEDPDEIIKLYWERARVLRETGDREGALAALESVAVLDPDHVGALALTGEIHITGKDFPRAAESLARLARLQEAPAKQRLMSGVAAADIYETKLGDLEQALGVLMMLFEEGLSTLAVRERLARVAAKTESWTEATRVLEHLMRERPTSEGRAEAARLCMVIWRDRLAEPARALGAVEALLREAPDDGEAIDLVLSDPFPKDASRQLLEIGRAALVERLTREPLEVTLIERLARIAEHENNLPLRQAALGALVTVGAGSAEIDAELTALDERVAHIPQIAVDVAALPELTDPADAGPLSDLMAWLAPGLAEAIGPQLSTFGVGKPERVDPRKGLPLRNEIAAWAGALGVGDFDLYQGGPDPDLIVGLPSERPAVVVGSRITSPLGIQHRQALARELFAIVRGTSILRHRSPTDIAALIVAACRVGGHEVPSPQYAMLADLERQLARGLPRRYRKGLVERGAVVAASDQDPLEWIAAAVSSLDRLATIAAGDVSRVLASDAVLGQTTASMSSTRRVERLLAFALSSEYLLLREQLGMGVK